MNIFLNQRFQSFLIYRRGAALEEIDLTCINIDACHAMPKIRKASAGDKTNISSTNNDNIHKKLRSRVRLVSKVSKPQHFSRGHFLNSARKTIFQSNHRVPSETIFRKCNIRNDLPRNSWKCRLMHNFRLRTEDLNNTFGNKTNRIKFCTSHVYRTNLL